MPPGFARALCRHIALCRNFRAPGGRLKLVINDQPAGWVAPAAAARLAAWVPKLQGSNEIRLAPTDLPHLSRLARRLAEEGMFRWRGEEFDIRLRADGPAMGRIDRGALPMFGLIALGVHVNGLVRRGRRAFLWVARRAMTRPLDPGKLDHLVAGGIPAGLSAAETLRKEAAEEAAIPPYLADQAVAVGRIVYAMERPEGLRRDVLFCYDLHLPEDFVPVPADGEVTAFELWPLKRVLETVAAGDLFKFNVNLVLIDLFLRYGLLPAAEARALAKELAAGSI